MGSETKTRKKKPGDSQQAYKIMFLVVFLAVLAAVLIIVKGMNRKKPQEPVDIEKGRAYLTQLQSGDVQEYARKINDIAKEKHKAILMENPDAVWSAFNDAIILGDSRATGFEVYELLPADKVLAKKGGKITDVEKDATYLPTLQTKQPSSIFVCYGLNDVLLGVYKDGEKYAAKILEEVNKIKEVCPNSSIYITSIVPAIGNGLNKGPDVPRIPEFNEGIAAMCSENNLKYIDLTDIAAQNQDKYQPDGLHFRKSFYILWATAMINEVE